jgi:hypothetical protein
MAECQSLDELLTHRYREQAPSHISPAATVQANAR